jgi:hypothetical protein
MPRMFLPLNTRYRGQRNGRTGAKVVTVSRGASMERLLVPGASRSVIDHSHSGFEWGYGGSGPGQLALAILLDFTQDQELAVCHHHNFKWAYVAEWTEASFQISGAEIVAWLQSQGAAISPAHIPSDKRS